MAWFYQDGVGARQVRPHLASMSVSWSMSDIRNITVSSSPQTRPGSSLTPSVFLLYIVYDTNFELFPSLLLSSLCLILSKKHFILCLCIVSLSSMFIPSLPPSLRVGNERYMMRLLTFKSIKLFVVLIPSSTLLSITRHQNEHVSFNNNAIIAMLAQP